MRIGDKDLVNVFRNTANIQDFCALLIRRDELLANDFGGDWKNVPDV